MGQPIEAEHYAANGDSQQRTSRGLMVWRKADNWTAFTDGSRTWVNGPDGAVERGNDERFSWEAPGPVEYPIRGRFVDILVMDHQDPQLYSSVRMATLARLVEKQLDTPVRLITGATEADLARPPADGYTLGYVGLPELVEGSLSGGSAPARREYQPVALESLEPVAVAVPKESRFKTLGEVVDAARLNPGRLRVRAETVLGRVAAGELGRLAGTEFTLVRNGSDPVDLEVQLLSRLLPGRQVRQAAAPGGDGQPRRASCSPGRRPWRGWDTICAWPSPGATWCGREPRPTWWRRCLGPFREP